MCSEAAALQSANELCQVCCDYMQAIGTLFSACTAGQTIDSKALQSLGPAFPHEGTQQDCSRLQHWLREMLHGEPVSVQPSRWPHLIRKLNVVLLRPAPLLGRAGELRVAIIHILHQRLGTKRRARTLLQAVWGQMFLGCIQT